MRAPKKVIAAMAMATLLGGTAAPAFAAQEAAQQPDEKLNYDFVKDAGSPQENPLQKTQRYHESNTQLTSDGYIQVNGTFKKDVTNFPAASKTGHYLRVSMPIELGYTYNLENDNLVSATGDVINKSAYENVQENKSTPKTVKMTFMELIQTSNEKNMKYVDESTMSTLEEEQVGLPFEVVLRKNNEPFMRIPLASITTEKQNVNNVNIPGGTDLQLKIEKIGGQGLIHKDKLSGDTASVGHKMKMKFEYVEQQ